MDNEEKKTENQNAKNVTERKLTAAEQRRLTAFRITEKELLEKGYKEINLTTTALKANALGLLYGVALAFLIFLIGLVCGARMQGSESPAKGIFLMLLFIVLIVVHELIHGITWGLFAKGGFRKNIEFGFIVESLTPYCTCKAGLSRGAYLLGGLMPCIVLGILPCVAALVLADAMMFGLGAMMIVAAGGDLLVAQMILTHKTKGKDTLYFDHPSEIGLMLFEK